MAKTSEERKDIHTEDINTENNDFFKTWEDIYTPISKMWEDSYIKLYKLWLVSKGKLFEKAAELSRDATPQKYQEFYEEWVKTYQNAYSNFYEIHTVESSREAFEKLLASAESMRPSKVAFENFVRNASVDLNISRSWIAILEKLSQKARELSKQNTDPETYKEYYSLWVKTYEKAFENFFENIPTVSPFKEIFEPVKNAAKIYTDTFTRISSNWIKSYPMSASAV